MEIENDEELKLIQEHRKEKKLSKVRAQLCAHILNPYKLVYDPYSINSIASRCMADQREREKGFNRALETLAEGIAIGDIALTIRGQLIYGK